MLAFLLCSATVSLWACERGYGTAEWSIGHIAVLGAQSDEQAALTVAAARVSLAQTPKLQLCKPCGDPLPTACAADVMQLQLRFTPHALLACVQPLEGFGASFEAQMPVTSLWDRHHLAFVIGEALKATLVMRELDRLGPAALRATIAGTGPVPTDALPASAQQSVRSFAVRRVAQLRDVASLPLLRAVLGQMDDGGAAHGTVRLQAVGSLVAMCDRQAVLPIIASTRHQDVSYVAQMAHAVAAIGGPMAEAYLVTLATGHLDAWLRQEAEVALADLMRQKKHKSGCGALARL